MADLMHMQYMPSRAYNTTLEIGLDLAGLHNESKTLIASYLVHTTRACDATTLHGLQSTLTLAT